MDITAAVDSQIRNKPAHRKHSAYFLQLNILFVNYDDSLSNSMSHIAPYANALSQRGHSCTVAVVTKSPKHSLLIETPLFSIRSYQEILEGTALAFPNSGPADIIHAWTPRENVRSFVEAYLKKHNQSALIIHLEDNEDSILENYYQQPIDQLRFPLPNQNEPEWNQRLCHPLKYQRFLWEADAITTITPTLEKLLPTPKPTLNVSPILDPTHFAPNSTPSETRIKYGIPEEKKLIVYPGGVTSANREDIRNLYLAAKLVTESGTPCIVAKTGPNCPDLENSIEFQIDEIRIDLGYIAFTEINNLVYAADLLVQPAKDSEFNRDRLPCKIPEFLLSARPSILPDIYKSLFRSDKECAFFTEAGNPKSLATACLELLADKERSKQIGANARTFALKKYSPDANTTILEKFYRASLKQSKDSKAKPLELNEDFRSRYLQAQKALKKAEQEIVSLNKDIRTFQSERERLMTENKCLFHSRDSLQENIDRIRNSGSWHITQPLRFIRRHLVDPLKSPKHPHLPPKKGNDSSEKRLTKEFECPPESHPCHHKGYYDFTIRHQHKVNAYISEFKERFNKLENTPTISILLPTYNVDEIWLRKCIDSVTNQVYPNWELCIADDASPRPHIRATIEEYQKRFLNIKACFRKTNGHISAASNSAYELSTGDYIALLDHDDEIPPHALAQVIDTINTHPTAKIIYSDEDKIDERGIRHDPHFKTDWNYDFFMGCNMISHFGIYERTVFEEAKGFRTGFEGAQDWDLALRIAEKIEAKDIIHIPEVLYHWRSIPGSTAFNLGQKEYAYLAQKRTIKSHFERMKIDADLQSVRGVNWRVIYKIPTPAPKVCIIIPTKDKVELLRPCVESILIKTSYPNFEIQIVDNASTKSETQFFLKHLTEDPRVTVVKDQGSFNYSRINNEAILRTDSTLICLLNNDTEVIDGSWLTEMVRHANRPEIGVVGAKLLFPHQHVQHCGVIMGIYDIAGHAFKYLHKDDDGHVGRAKLVSAYSAVTGACMLFKKEHWQLIGGLNEQQLAVSYNDIDFCLRLGQKGFRTLLTPFSQLYHNESDSRGPIESDQELLQLEAESHYMRKKWQEVIAADPYYNPNFTRSAEDFSYATE